MDVAGVSRVPFWSSRRNEKRAERGGGHGVGAQRREGKAKTRAPYVLFFRTHKPSSQVSTRCVACRAIWCSCSAPRRARGVLSCGGTLAAGRESRQCARHGNPDPDITATWFHFRAARVLFVDWWLACAGLWRPCPVEFLPFTSSKKAPSGFGVQPPVRATGV
jgi:hypothetical protein